jgi:hypothetical protein
MLDFVDIKDDIEPLVAVVEAFSSATSRADRASLLAQIRDQLEKLQRELGEFFERPSEGGVGAAEAEQTALVLREGEGAAAKLLLPRILSLQGYLTGTSLNDDPEAHLLLQKAINIAVGYVAGYQDLRDQLIRFDAERRAAPDKIRYARPVVGEIDHTGLTREIIARFPGILAALAK